MTLSQSWKMSSKINLEELKCCVSIDLFEIQVEVIVKNAAKKSNVSEGEKKVCLWPVGAGTTCGKTFTKFDSLKRHLAETHKGQ